ncbi:hypothetical protein ABZ801_01215 [Actinomadura sp. NPDC047616]|uniref:hypothetical protein n=1 Tax=Actinomadura sp. NPDC047616 TaxID=3155914 RepID=UPI0033C72741
MTHPEHDDMRECAAGAHCAARTGDGPARTPRPFCEADRARIAAALDAMPRYHGALGKALGERHTGPAEHVSGAPTPAAPIRLDLADLAHQLHETLLGWEERVRAVARLPDAPTRGVRPTVAVTRAAATLASHLDALLALPAEPMARPKPSEEDGWSLIDLDGVDAGLELLDLARRCRAALGLTRAPQRMAAPCGTCGLMLLERADGPAGLDDAATCTSCGTYYSPAEYAALAAQALHGATT